MRTGAAAARAGSFQGPPVTNRGAFPFLTSTPVKDAIQPLAERGPGRILESAMMMSRTDYAGFDTILYGIRVVVEVCSAP